MRFAYALLLAIAFGADGAESVGSQACASCHAAIYRTFMRTQMAQSSGRMGTQESKEQFDRAEFRDSSGARDPQTLLYLAQLHRERSDDARARPLYEEVWRMDREHYAAGAALGAYQMQAGNLEEAVRLWRQTLAISPALLLVRANLATALLRTVHPDQAQETLRKALEFSPSFQPATDLLDQIVK